MWEQNLSVYGADKVWDQLNKDGIRVARCTVERLMGDMGLQGCRRGRVWVRTTDGDDRLDRPADLVERQFRAPGTEPAVGRRSDLREDPHRLGVRGVHRRRVLPHGRRLAGLDGRCAPTWRSTPWRWPCTTGGRTDSLDGLVHHSDRGVQYLSVRYSQRLADNDIVASVGSKGDSYDNALVESFNGLYKWELIYPQGPWRGLEDVECATLTYVDWFNHRRLHGEINRGPGYTTPAAFEAAYYRQTTPATRPGPNNPSLYETRGASHQAGDPFAATTPPRRASSACTRGAP